MAWKIIKRGFWTKQMLAFKAADGAGEHCEMGNRSLLNHQVFDWLDETFAT